MLDSLKNIQETHDLAIASNVALNDEIEELKRKNKKVNDKVKRLKMEHNVKVQELEQAKDELEERVEQLEQFEQDNLELKELVEEYETESVEMMNALHNHDKCLICMDKMATCVARCGHKICCVGCKGRLLRPMVILNADDSDVEETHTTVPRINCCPKCRTDIDIKECLIKVIS